MARHSSTFSSSAQSQPTGKQRVQIALKLQLFTLISDILILFNIWMLVLIKNEFI